MQQLSRHLLILLFITTLLLSCKKSLDVNADWKDVTVVYGILNQSDTIHYIKITKAFLGPGDALEYAKNPDSSNYPDILKVSLNEYTNGNPGRKIMLRDTLITNKDSGIFYFPVQKLFYSKEKLSELKDYKLTIIDTVTSKTIEASTKMITEFPLEKPAYLPGVIMVPNRGSDVQWVTPSGGKRFQLTIRIYYSEFRKGDSAKTFHKLDWLVFNNVKSIYDNGGQTITYTIPGMLFYEFLESKLIPDPDIERSLGNCDYIFFVGSGALDTYLEVADYSNFIAGPITAFSNITNGVGLFASRHAVSFDTIQFADITKDSLKTNSHTKNLGF